VRSICTLVCAIVLLATTLPLERATAADRSWRRHTGHYRVARLELASTYYGSCREGWWQSLRYGHVQPYWGLRCR
jgi:hypothetical protein